MEQGQTAARATSHSSGAKLRSGTAAAPATSARSKQACRGDADGATDRVQTAPFLDQASRVDAAGLEP